MKKVNKKNQVTVIKTSNKRLDTCRNSVLKSSLVTIKIYEDDANCIYNKKTKCFEIHYLRVLRNNDKIEDFSVMSKDDTKAIFAFCSVAKNLLISDENRDAFFKLTNVLKFACINPLPIYVSSITNTNDAANNHVKLFVNNLIS